MSKDMYQKQKERNEKRENGANNNDEGLKKAVINWEMGILEKQHTIIIK